MSIKVEVKFEDQSKEALRAISANTIEALEEVERIVVPASREAVPVDEGKLLRSIGYQIDRREQTGKLYSGGKGAKHANLIEYGTYRTAPQSYMREPMERLKGAIKRIFIRKHKESA